jgi:hypothetical protein
VGYKVDLGPIDPESGGAAASRFFQLQQPARVTQ